MDHLYRLGVGGTNIQQNTGWSENMQNMSLIKFFKIFIISIVSLLCFLLWQSEYLQYKMEGGTYEEPHRTYS